MSMNVDLINGLIHLQPNEHLAFDHAANNFITVNRNTVLQPTCSKKIKVLSNKVKEVLKNHPLNTLQPTQVLNLTANIHRVNEIQQHYNNAISRNGLMNFFDKLLWVVTFGCISLKYPDINSAPLDNLVGSFLRYNDQGKFLLYLNYFATNPQIKFEFSNIRRRLLELSHPLMQNLDIPQKNKLLFIANENFDEARSFCTQLSDSNAIHLYHHMITFPHGLELGTIRGHLLNKLNNLNLPNLTPALKSKMIEILEEENNEASSVRLDRLLNNPNLIISLLEHLVSQQGVAEQKQDLALKMVNRLIVHAMTNTPAIQQIDLNERLDTCMSKLNEQQFPLRLVLQNFSVEKRKEFLTFIDAHRQEYPCVEHFISDFYTQNYAALLPEEHSIFFEFLLSKDIKLDPSREILFDLAEYLGQKKVQEKHSEQASILLKRIRRIENLKNPELKKLLAFANACEAFNFIKDKGSFLKSHIGKKRVWELIDLLSSKSELVTTYNSLAIQLCFCAAMEKQKKDSEETLSTVLQNLNISQLSKENFAFLTTSSSDLSKIFQVDPDRFLSTANEEQLEVYYKPLDKKLKVNHLHLDVKLTKKEAVPPLPVGVKVEFEELLKMSDEINFSDPKKPDYVNPNEMTNDGQLITPKEVRKGIAQLISNVTQRTVSYTPNDPAQKAAFYTNLERFLQHSIVSLRNRPPGQRSGFLVWLGGAGIYCGGRYMAVAQDLYCQVTGSSYNIAEESLEGGILKFLSDKRSMILKKRITDVTNCVHSFHTAMKTTGLKFNVPEAQVHQYDDPARGQDFNQTYEQNQLFEWCLEDYNTTVIINELVKNIEGIPGHKKTINLEFRTTIDDWFKENLPKDIKKKYAKEPDSCLSEIYQMDTGRIRRQWLIFMLKNMNMYVLEEKSKWNPFNWSFSLFKSNKKN